MAARPKSRILTVPYALPLSVLQVDVYLNFFCRNVLAHVFDAPSSACNHHRSFLRRISKILLCDMIQEMILLSFRAHFEFFTLHYSTVALFVSSYFPSVSSMLQDISIMPKLHLVFEFSNQEIRQSRVIHL
jgi:hypothetical protein